MYFAHSAIIVLCEITSA